ncbi:MAG TPA: oligosaccharide flippase family protein [Vicinamibacterales bacterium]|nr:oligosaccharide flippase family protein [Vicinamibacterales bacterium]
MSASPAAVAWHEPHQTRTVALNVGGRYLTLTTELLLGMVMLPFNIRFLGAEDYGLWMLAASIVVYFPVLQLGYGGAMDRFVAHYRARKDAAAINEIASTLVLVFLAVGALAFLAVAVIAWHLGALFELEARMARTGGLVLLLVASQYAVGLPFAVFGAIVNGFQRMFLNSAVGFGVALAVTAVNVGVLLAGGTLVQLIAATTATRLVGYALYRRNAYRVFPLLRIRPSLFRFARLREVTEFSLYVLMQDLANKTNYASDPIVIAAVLSTGAVAVWTVAQRLTDVVMRLANQLNEVLFPIVVDCDSAQREDRLRELLVQGTRLSLATVLPVAGALALLAEPVVVGWTGPDFVASARLVEILAVVVILRVTAWTSGTVLQGAGHHRLLAISNLIAAAVNVGLSILLIRRFGLPGVALATAVPATVRAVTVTVPVACRRVGISIWRYAALAIWPALWPGLIVLAGLALVRHDATSLLTALGLGAVAGGIYLALFLGIAIGRRDRHRYVGKLRSLAGRPALDLEAA